jgi:diguanylate cyclase
MAARAYRYEVGRNANSPQRQLSARHVGRHAGILGAIANSIGPTMNVLRFVRSRFLAAYALGVIPLGAVALTALQSFALGETLATLRSFIPSEVLIFELLLFGWFGLAIGRFTMAAESSAGRRDGPKATRQQTAAKEEMVNRVLRQIAKALQTHLTDSEAFSERLDGANKRLSQQQETVGPVNEIVLALIEDNRDMRGKLDSVRNQLEESRLQVMQLQTNLERAEEAGMRDVVTAIGNRRFFDSCFAEDVERARSVGDSFCLALADLDKFKQINDRFGHLVGDRLLRLFATILVQNVRGQDKVARFGGEEFALMFPGARLVDAVSAVERIRGILESKQWTVEQSGERMGKVTASFGVARLRANESASDLLKRVDQRLYQAKVQGRNRVVADSADEEASSSPRPARAKRAAAG